MNLWQPFIIMAVVILAPHLKRSDAHWISYVVLFIALVFFMLDLFWRLNV